MIAVHDPLHPSADRGRAQTDRVFARQGSPPVREVLRTQLRYGLYTEGFSVSIELLHHELHRVDVLRAEPFPTRFFLDPRTIRGTLLECDIRGEQHGRHRVRQANLKRLRAHWQSEPHDLPSNLLRRPERLLDPITNQFTGRVHRPDNNFLIRPGILF